MQKHILVDDMLDDLDLTGLFNLSADLGDEAALDFPSIWEAMEQHNV